MKSSKTESLIPTVRHDYSNEEYDNALYRVGYDESECRRNMFITNAYYHGAALGYLDKRSGKDDKYLGERYNLGSLRLASFNTFLNGYKEEYQ